MGIGENRHESERIRHESERIRHESERIRHESERFDTNLNGFDTNLNRIRNESSFGTILADSDVLTRNINVTGIVYKHRNAVEINKLIQILYMY